MIGSMAPRPATVPLATTLAVTASLQWLCALCFVWLVAASARNTLGFDGVDGAVFHLLDRVHNRLLDGLAWPLFLFPLAGFLTGFLVLVRRPWTRLAHTAVGLAAVGWSAWWLRDNLSWWLPAAAYVLISCLVLWTPRTTRWYAGAGSHPRNPVVAY